MKLKLFLYCTLYILHYHPLCSLMTILYCDKYLLITGQPIALLCLWDEND